MLDKMIKVALSFNKCPGKPTRERQEQKQESEKKTRKSKTRWTPEQQTSDTSDAIGRYNLSDMTDLLEEFGFKYCSEASDGNTGWTRPGKCDGISLTTKEINGVQIAYPFSSSIPELEAGRGYSKFQLLMAFKGLTAKQAYKYICKRGYEPPTKTDMALEDLAKICEIEYDEKGHVDVSSRLTLANILTYHPLFDGLAANTLCNDRLWAFKPIEGIEGRIDDKAFSMLRLVLQSKLGLNPSTNELIDALNIVMIRKRRNPFLERLDELQWDGVERLKTFLAEAFDLPQNALTEELLTKFFAAVIARQLSDEPIVVEWMPVFSGNQETGKTSFLRNCCKMLHPRLSEEWYLGSMDMTTFCDPKLRAERSEGAIICSIDDLKNVKKADDENFKAAMSTPRAIVRCAYGRFSTEVVQRFMLAATGNPQHFLKDPTGARRYIVLRIPLADDCCKLYDSGLMNSETVCQLWAEAYRWYKDNYHDPQDLRLSKEAKIIAREYAEDAYNSSPWEDEVQDYVNFRRRSPANAFIVKIDEAAQTVTMDEQLEHNFFQTVDVYKYLNGSSDFNIIKMEPKHQETIRGILTRIKEVESARCKNRRGYRVIPNHAVYKFDDYKTEAEKTGLQMLLESWRQKEPSKEALYVSKGICSNYSYRYCPLLNEQDDDE